MEIFKENLIDNSFDGKDKDIRYLNNFKHLTNLKINKNIIYILFGVMIKQILFDAYDPEFNNLILLILLIISINTFFAFFLIITGVEGCIFLILLAVEYVPLLMRVNIYDTVLFVFVLINNVYACFRFNSTLNLLIFFCEFILGFILSHESATNFVLLLTIVTIPLVNNKCTNSAFIMSCMFFIQSLLLNFLFILSNGWKLLLTQLISMMFNALLIAKYFIFFGENKFTDYKEKKYWLICGAYILISFLFVASFFMCGGFYSQSSSILFCYSYSLLLIQLLNLNNKIIIHKKKNI